MWPFADVHGEQPAVGRTEVRGLPDHDRRGLDLGAREVELPELRAVRAASAVTVPLVDETISRSPAIAGVDGFGP